jgi:serine/threonine protein kinase/tetratricopeptide (TPR) repeat protein
MRPAQENGDDLEARIAGVIAAFHRALDAGKPVSPEEWLCRYPDLADELRDYFAAQEELAHVATPLRRVARAEGDSTPRLGGTQPEGAPPAGTGEPGMPFSLFGDYELLEEIGRGGMGVIYRARHRSLNRLVALKRIHRDRLGSAADVQRFRNEAEAAAGLDHPHIVPILEVGDCDGQPYFTMKLIEGGNLSQFISRRDADANNISLRLCVKLLIEVARPVHHAHQRGILHRDLKPSNVLLDAAGVPHVTDFGLAKRLQGDSSLTRSGDLLGTPSYMAPEQAGGGTAAVTVATDVYGCGAILYALLTGRPPFRGIGVLETLDQVRHQEPPRPRASNPRVDRDLETICLKCLEKEPGRRYGSAEALAEDLERWLVGELVAARPPSRMDRLRKFVRRNKGPVGATAAVIGLLVLGLVGTSIGLNRALEAEANATRAAESESWQRRLAEVAYEGEVQQRREARKAVDEMYSQFAEQWLNERPRLEKTQREFVEKVLRYYEKFALAESTDPQERFETAYAYFRVGQIQHRLGQEVRAEEAYGRAISIFAALADGHAAEARYHYGLLRSHNRLGGVLLTRNQLKRAEAAYLEGAKVGESLVASFPQTSDHWLELASSFDGLGLLLHRTGRDEEAERYYRRALEFKQTKAELAAAQPAYFRNLAATHRGLGNVLWTAKRLKDAEQEHRRSVALLEKLVADFPGPPDYREDLCMSRANLAGVLKEIGRLPDAIQLVERTLEDQEKLVREFSESPQYQRTLAATYQNLGIIQNAAGHRDRAEAAYGKAIAVVEKLAARFETFAEYQQLMAYCYFNRGNLLRESGRMPDAETDYAQALAIRKKLVEKFPAVPAYRQELGHSYMVLGVLLGQTTREREALEAFRTGLALNPDNARLRDGFSWLLATCADPALRDPARAVALAKAAVAQDQHNDGYRLTLAVALYRSGDWKSSVAALEAAGKLTRAGATSKGFIRAMALWHLGNKLDARKHYDEAVALLETHASQAGVLVRLRTEAAELLGITEPPRKRDGPSSPEGKPQSKP